MAEMKRVWGICRVRMMGKGKTTGRLRLVGRNRKER